MSPRDLLHKTVDEEQLQRDHKKLAELQSEVGDAEARSALYCPEHIRSHPICKGILRKNVRLYI